FDDAGNLFAANDDYRTGSVNSIDKFPPDGPPSSFATGLRYPVGLAFDNAGYLFVADEDASEIYKFAPSGTPSPFRGVPNAYGLVFDSADSLLATGGSQHDTIYKIATDGTFTNFFGVSGYEIGRAH